MTRSEVEVGTRARALVERMLGAVFGRADADAIPMFFAPQLAPLIAHHHRELFGAFSDLRVDVEEMITEGERVAARLTLSGTHDGPFAGHPPTGRRATWTSFRFYRIAHDKIVDTSAMQDRLGLLQQLGVVPDDIDRVSWAAEARPARE